MEDDAVIEALARQLLDALDVLGREIGPQGDHDFALRGVHDQRVLGVFDGGHWVTPFRWEWG